MKKMIVDGLSFIVVLAFMITIFVNEKGEKEVDASYLRVHIRANSNNEKDQEVKYKVKVAVVDYLTPQIAEGSSFSEAYSILNDNLKNIEKVADEVLVENGFDYGSKAKLNEEYFPTRNYGEYTLENGYYDALIVELGSGKGDNWWCVVYPPLCFIGGEGTGKNVKYKSKLIEIVQNFFN